MTTLMEEEPYAAVVDSDCLSATCYKCFAWNCVGIENVKLSRCAGCRVIYYCGSDCQKADWEDHKAECKFLRPFFDDNFVPCGTTRLIMRMMAKSRKQPDFESFNGRTYDSLMHHSEKRRENANCFAEATTIYGEIYHCMGSKAPDFDTVFLALSKKAINAVPMHDGSWLHIPRGVGVYLGLSVLDHSCRPDAFIVSQGSKMLLRTTKEGCVYSDKLTINYHGELLFMDTNTRRARLLDSYFFHCKCDECEDIELDKKRISGRPACCPNSWFSPADLICNNCNKEVSPQLVAKFEDVMEHLNDVARVFNERPGSDPFALVTEFMNLFDSANKVLSDENTFLLGVVSSIFIFMSLIDAKAACKYADLCAPQARKRPYCLFSASLLSFRQQYYELAQKPLYETKQALNEAIDSVQVVFGPQHELTRSLLQKKMLLDFENLNTR